MGTGTSSASESSRIVTPKPPRVSDDHPDKSTSSVDLARDDGSVAPVLACTREAQVRWSTLSLAERSVAVDALLSRSPPAALSTRRLRRAFGAAALLLLGACASLERPIYAPSTLARAGASDLGGIRYAPPTTPIWTDRPGDEAHDVLVLSGGGPDGAYGAGLLAGLRARGTLPEFDVVTGVSIGALMAPFAFLGGDALERLAALWTDPEVGRILKSGSPLRLLAGPAVYRGRNIQRLIETHVSNAMITRVAAEHRRGRRLLVATANLDAERLTVWDLGAIAARGEPGDAALFRSVLLAAVSIPVAFAPVAFPVPLDAGTVVETHTDATIFSMIYIERSLFPTERCRRGTMRCSLSVVVHNKIGPEPETVRWSAGGVGGRAMGAIVKSSLQAQLGAARRLAADEGIAFRLAWLDTPLPGVGPLDFEPAYMRQILDYGRERASAFAPWSPDWPGTELVAP